MQRPAVIGALVGVLAGLSADCGDSSCLPGRESCACTVQGTCDEGLACMDGTCIDPGGTASSGVAETSSGPTTSASTTMTSSSEDPTQVDSSSESGPVIPCGMADFRAASFNVLAVGDEGSDEWNALGSILARIEPDVICIEEINDFETAPFRALADSLGWGEPIQADPSPAIGGELRNGCFGPRTMNRTASYTAADLASDGNANDLARDIIAVRVELDDGCHANVLAIHAKSGQEDLDRFRRQVEFVRLAQAIDDVRAKFPGEGVVVMGDFNENLDDPMIGQVFTEVPAGLPESYRLGSDIELPLTYDPFTTVAGAGMTRLDPTAEDSTRDATWGVSDGFDGVRLDYIWLDGIELGATMIYDACLDDGVDADPPGAWLPLSGDPVPCFASQTASDHLPVVADLHVP